MGDYEMRIRVLATIRTRLYADVLVMKGMLETLDELANSHVYFKLEDLSERIAVDVGELNHFIDLLNELDEGT